MGGLRLGLTSNWLHDKRVDSQLLFFSSSVISLWFLFLPHSLFLFHFYPFCWFLSLFFSFYLYSFLFLPYFLFISSFLFSSTYLLYISSIIIFFFLFCFGFFYISLPKYPSDFSQLISVNCGSLQIDYFSYKNLLLLLLSVAK